MQYRQKVHTVPHNLESGISDSHHAHKHTHAQKTQNTYRAPNYPTQRIPGSFIKPVEKLIEAICGEVVSRPVVEPKKTINQRQDS